MVDVIIVDSRDIWLALAQVQQAQVLSQVLAAVSVPLVVGMGVVDLFHAVDLLVDPAKLLVTSAEDPTILPVTASLKL